MQHDNGSTLFYKQIYFLCSEEGGLRLQLAAATPKDSILATGSGSGGEGESNH
jgi:hypothetical protein